MKGAALAFLCLLPALALSQFSATFAVKRAVESIQGRDPTQGLAAKPTEPTGFPGLPPTQGELPAPAADTGQGQVRILSAGEISRKGDLFRVEGGAHIQYRGYDIVGEVVEGNLRSEEFEATKGAKVFGEDAYIEADRIRVFVKTRSFHAWNAAAQLEPPLLRSYVLDPVYVKAAESWGTEQEIFGSHAATTTCNLQEPHFHLDSESVIVRPGRRAIFRNVKINVLGRTLIRLPFLSVPLNQPAYRYLPEVGRNEQDGYFIKTRYGVPMRGRNNFDARLDWFEKRGTAGGGDFSYTAETLSGLLGFYALSGDSDTLHLNSQHQQRFGWGSLSIDASYQQDSFLTSADSTFLTARAALRFPTRSGITRFGFNMNQNEGIGFSSEVQTVTLSDIRRFGSTTTTNLDLSWVTSEGTSEREQVDVKFRGEHDLRAAVARLEYQRSIPVGDIENFFSPTDRTPLLTFTSNAKRLLGDRAPDDLPFTTELSMGEFVEPLTRDHIVRTAFDLAFQRPTWEIGRSDFSFNGRFRQGVYSDDTAQYVLALGLGAGYQLGRDSRINFRYNYLRPYGFSPLSIDQTGRTNLVSGDLSVRANEWLTAGLQTGYDIDMEDQGTRTPWQFVGLRLEANPATWFSLRTLATYDSDQRSWSNIRFDLAYRPGATFVSLGTQYDAIRQRWGRASLFVDALRWGRIRAAALIQYNGYLERIESQHYSLIYDLHCAEAVLQFTDDQTGFRAGRQVSLFVRLKALPSISPFGVGTFGQPLGTGGGRRF